jgi:phosphoribosylformylglycinamidine (FGAM) synthase PurS component
LYFFAELKSTLEYKISQLETVKSQQIELETQLKKSDAMFMEQKRLLNAVKEEYEEKFVVSLVG